MIEWGRGSRGEGITPRRSPMCPYEHLHVDSVGEVGVVTKTVTTRRCPLSDGGDVNETPTVGTSGGAPKLVQSCVAFTFSSSSLQTCKDILVVYTTRGLLRTSPLGVTTRTGNARDIIDVFRVGPW